MGFIRDEDFKQTRPRRKNEGLGPAPKKKRKASAIEEVAFDRDARQEYLTGFHKRKLQRQKIAQEAAALREKQEKTEFRRQLREDRARQVEEHVRHVESLLNTHNLTGAIDEEKEWSGIDDPSNSPTDPPTLVPSDEIVDIEEEYIDEDRYTTVKVESVTVTRDGLERPGAEAEAAAVKRMAAKKAAEEAKKSKKPKKTWPKKDKKNKFRYENKIERVIDRATEQARNKAKRAKFAPAKE